VRRVHPIELESYRILRGLVDLSYMGPLSRAVGERVIHASADLEYAESLVLDETALEAGLEALRGGAPVVTDVGMVAAGSISIDKVAGPIGEALVMTAAGIAVAVPAVLAYNIFGKWVAATEAELEGFAHDLREMMLDRAPNPDGR